MEITRCQDHEEYLSHASLHSQSSHDHLNARQEKRSGYSSAHRRTLPTKERNERVEGVEVIVMRQRRDTSEHLPEGDTEGEDIGWPFREDRKRPLWWSRDPPLCAAVRGGDDSDSEWLFRSSRHSLFSHSSPLLSAVSGEVENVKMEKVREVFIQRLPTVSEAQQEGPFPCTIMGCSALLKSQTALRKHALVHAEKSHACEECGARFAERSKLTRHLRSHSNDKPFKCVVEGCGKRFAYSFNLVAHAKLHTGEKLFACELCGRRFSKESNLKVHVDRHNGFRRRKRGQPSSS